MTAYVFDSIIIISGFAFFGFIHTFLAKSSIKRIIAEELGNLIAFYRLAYNLFSLFILYLLFEYLPKPDFIIYDLPYPYDLVIFVFRFISLCGFIWSAAYFSIPEFLGISQVIRWSKREYDMSDIDDRLTLNIRGPYKFVRHPVYFFSILLLALRPAMDLFYLNMLVSFILYFYIGSLYEEKKLVEKFGINYLLYRNSVPGIIPLKLRGRKHSE